VLTPGLSGTLWPIHPHPQNDELLSSWVVRLAHSNGLKVQAFCTLLAGRDSAFWNRDIDRSPSERLLVALRQCTGATQDEVEATTLRGFEGTYFDKLTTKTNCPWILPLGIYHRTRRRFGLQVCGGCLREGSTAYFRRRWRLAAVVVCPQHQCLMVDRCAACGAPVAFHREELGRRRIQVPDSLADCWACHHPFHNPEVFTAANDAQRCLVQLAAGCLPPKVTEECSATPYYAGLHLFANVLLSKRPAAIAFAEKVAEEVSSFATSPRTHRAELEALGPKARSSVLEAAIWLADDWPNHFNTVLARSRAGAGRLRAFSRHWPGWVLRALDAHGSGKRPMAFGRWPSSNSYPCR
jgi:TniQ